MSFTWRAFVDRHRIPHDEEGTGAARRGNIAIWCPWCNAPDGDKRWLGLHLHSSSYGCWKDPSHRGSDPVRLIRAVLRCPWTQAVEEAQQGVSRSPVAELKARLAAIGQSPDVSSGHLAYPEEFVRFDGATEQPLSWYRDYVSGRGFPDEHADQLSRRYALRAAVGGRFDRRVIIPFHDIDGNRIGWSGRAIGKHNTLRYLTEGSTSEVVFNAHRVAREGGRVLVPVEGPFDALKIDYYGADVGIRSVAIAGLGNVGNVGLLTAIFQLGGFERVILLLDASALSYALRLQRSFRHLPASIGRCPKGVKDPGDFTPAMVRALDAGGAFVGDASRGWDRNPGSGRSRA